MDFRANKEPDSIINKLEFPGPFLAAPGQQEVVRASMDANQTQLKNKEHENMLQLTSSFPWPSSPFDPRVPLPLPVRPQGLQTHALVSESLTAFSFCLSVGCRRRTTELKHTHLEPSNLCS